MKSRLNKIPILKAEAYYINASHYNRVRLALARLGKPLRIELVNLCGLDVILDDTEWVCVDRKLADLPAVAWTDFKVGVRNNLHKPVACQVRYYHDHADLVCDTVLFSINRYLKTELALKKNHQRYPVSYLPT